MSEILYRAIEIGDTDTVGRNLSGIAMPWDRPTLVRDLTGPAYVEAFSPTSADVSMKQRASFPMFVRHDYRQDPLGVVTFHRSAEALMFEAAISKTQRGDEHLELVNDGAERSVSVGFKPLHQVRRLLGRSSVEAYRTEVMLRELSLAPTGFGQYAEAGVLAVRSDTSFNDMQDAVEDAITKQLFGDSGPGDGVYLYVVDCGPDFAVYSVEGGTLDKAIVGAQYQRVEYTVAEDGTVTLSDPVDVAKAWEPTGRSTPLLDAMQWRRAARLKLIRTPEQL